MRCAPCSSCSRSTTRMQAGARPTAFPIRTLMIRKYLTISVDDGHPTDLISAELLDRFNLKATFYVPKTNPEREVMGDQHLRQIGESFDVGGHTVGHTSLKVMNDARAFAEIS